MTDVRDAEPETGWRAMIAQSEAVLRPRRVISGAVVHETILEIHSTGGMATRQTIAEVLEVPVGRLDDHIKRLFEAGLIRRVMPGVFEPVTLLPQARAVSMTKLVDGMTKLEVGDVCLDLTPQECRAIATMLLGAAFEFHLLTSSRDLADQIADLREKHFRIKEELCERATVNSPQASDGRLGAAG